MVITTGRDEHGSLLPVVFTSFGDFKAPFAVYLTGVSTTLLGLTAWAVRLPFALAGSITVGMIGVLVWLRTRSLAWGVLAAWLLSTLPWHIHFSRIGFESGITALFFVSILAGWQALRPNAVALSQSSRNLWWGVIVCCTALGLYTYHSSKIVFPLSILMIVIWEAGLHTSFWLKRWKEWLTAGFFGGVLLLPFMWSLNSGGLNRAGQTVFWQHLNAQETFLERFFYNISTYLSPQFLVFGASDSLRHSTGFSGILTITLLLVCVVGPLFLIWNSFTHNTNLFAAWKKRFTFLQKDTAQSDWPIWIGLTLIGFLPALIGFEVPHANRAFLAVIPLIVFATLTLQGLFSLLPGNAKQTLIASVLLFSALESAAFWHDLRNDYPARSSAAWMDGYAQASRLAGQAAKLYQPTAFTKEYGQPEIFFAFENSWPIDRFRANDFGSIQFMDQDQLETTTQQIIFSAKPLERNDVTLQQEILRKDGLPGFWIYQKHE